VTPIATSTKTPGKPIGIKRDPQYAAFSIAISADGKTAYVTSWVAGTVTPITTATNTPGKPIKVGPMPYAIAP
jgi:YVTN family beta-propeller protein